MPLEAHRGKHHAAPGDFIVPVAINKDIAAAGILFPGVLNQSKGDRLDV